MSANFSSSSTNDNFGENKEYKDISYGIGGDANALAVPNYIKYYRSNLNGQSLGSHASELCSSKSYTTSVSIISNP
jgi:hypothetical protein